MAMYDVLFIGSKKKKLHRLNWPYIGPTVVEPLTVCLYFVHNVSFSLCLLSWKPRHRKPMLLPIPTSTKLTC
jgi:hypothetical protein